MIDINKITIAGEWSGHCKLIYYDGVTVGYIRNAVANRHEAVSLIKSELREFDATCSRTVTNSMIIAAKEMLEKS